MKKKPISAAIKKIISLLNSENPQDVKTALASIPSKGHPEVIPHLIKAMLNSSNEEIYSSSLAILNQLKDPDCIPFLLTEIKKEYTFGHRHTLLSCIWQSGFETNEIFSEIIDLSISEDYLCGIECLTIIENMETVTNDRFITSAIQKLQPAIETQEEKQMLLMSIVEIIKSWVVVFRE